VRKKNHPRRGRRRLGGLSNWDYLWQRTLKAMVAVPGSGFQAWSLSSPSIRDDRGPKPCGAALRLDGRGGRPHTSDHCPITPSRTPFSLTASNHATFCPNQVLVPESLYFLVAAAKSRVPSR